jgi:hypothetical protein
MSEALVFVLGPAVSQFSQALRDLVNLGDRGLASLQVLVAGMDVGLLSERRVVMTCPLADDQGGSAALRRWPGVRARLSLGRPPGARRANRGKAPLISQAHRSSARC